MSSELLSLTLEHIEIVLATVLLAAALALPIAVAVAHRAALRRWTLGFANLTQTIPSLALMGFLLALTGIGKPTAIIALWLYALLPILRNTVTGILAVDPAVREAAVGMGMTGRQILWQVELPLAAAPIVAGLRIATVTTIGTATIAAEIGGGGLGVFIFRGIAMADSRTVLYGAIPAAILALLADALLGWVGRRWPGGRPAGPGVPA